SGRDQPAHGERLGPIRAHLDRHLIGGATYTAGAHLHFGADIVQRFMERPQRIISTARCDLVEGAIDDAFGDRLLPVQHEVVHEFAENDITELRVRQDLSLFSAMTARHLGLAPHLGRLAPYFDRRWRRADRKSTRLNSSHVKISYAVFCLKKKISEITNKK